MTPAQYFKKKRGVANGIVYAGGGLGGAVISFIMNSLLTKLGPAWAFRVIGFITLGTGLPAAYLIKERTTIRPSAFIEWSVYPLPLDDENLFLTTPQEIIPGCSVCSSLCCRGRCDLSPLRPAVLLTIVCQLSQVVLQHWGRSSRRFQFLLCNRTVDLWVRKRQCWAAQYTVCLPPVECYQHAGSVACIRVTWSSGRVCHYQRYGQRWVFRHHANSHRKRFRICQSLGRYGHDRDWVGWRISLGELCPISQKRN